MYRGKLYSERLPFECRAQEAFSGSQLVTYPLYQASSLPDGSVMVFNLNGLCERLADRDPPGGEPKIIAGTRHGFIPLSGPLEIVPPYASWLSEPRNPRVIDIYLVNRAEREDIGGYRAAEFSVEPADAPSRKIKAAVRRVAPTVWRSAWPPALDYCGGTTTTLDYQGPVTDAVRVPMGAYESTSRRDGLFESSRPILHNNGAWRAYTGQSSVIRLYRSDTVRIPTSFQYGSRQLPFQHTGRAQRSHDVTINVRCPDAAD